MALITSHASAQVAASHPTRALKKSVRAACFCLAPAAVLIMGWQPVLAIAAEPVFLYTVRKGDELIKMSAESFSSPDDWKEIVSLNKMKDPNANQPGQILKIPTRLMKLFSKDATLVSTAGDVQLGGAKVSVGTAVPEGSQLKTGRNSSAVLELADGSRVTLLPNTLAELTTSRTYGLRADTSTSGSSNWFSGLLRLSTGVLETFATFLEPWPHLDGLPQRFVSPLHPDGDLPRLANPATSPCRK